MFRKTIVLILSIFAASCASDNSANKKIVNLSNGKTAEVFFEKQISPENEPVLVVDYITEEQMVREKEVEAEVLEIWNGVKDEAEKLELGEAVIRYKFFSGQETENGKPVKLYTGLIFTAERIENGNWKIDKIY